MEESWDAQVSPLMATVGMNDNIQDLHEIHNENPVGNSQAQRNHLLFQELSNSSTEPNFYNTQLLLGGVQTTNPPDSSPTSGAGSISPVGSAGMSGALSPGGTNSNSGPPTSSTQCCESGKPIMTDPVTGQTICSCQYDQTRFGFQYTRGVNVYSTPYPSTEQNPYPSLGVDASAFYSPLSNPYGLKDAGSTTDMSWTTTGLQPTTGYYAYDPTLAAYGYGAGYDLAARRKNATRESTATLKAWLNEHKKNPYPTKGEKIMLAIITKMTLTQVSTWFANARRRLKKENKMTWEPKNKTDEDDDALCSDSDDKDKDDDDKGNATDLNARIKSESDKDLDDDDIVVERTRKETLMNSNSSMHQIFNNTFGIKPELKPSDCGVPLPPSKPKIWSLADTAACKTPPPPPPPPTLSNHHHHQWLGNSGFTFPGGRYAGGGNCAAVGFLPGHCQPGFTTDVQTDTPPQTPPSMKLPTITGNSLPNHPCLGSHSTTTATTTNNIINNNNNSNATTNNQPPFVNNIGRIQSPQQRLLPHHHHHHHHHVVSSGAPPDSAAAFKPFYKSMQYSNGSFVSPV